MAYKFPDISNLLKKKQEKSINDLIYLHLYRIFNEMKKEKNPEVFIPMVDGLEDLMLPRLDESYKNKLLKFGEWYCLQYYTMQKTEEELNYILAQEKLRILINYIEKNVKNNSERKFVSDLVGDFNAN